MSYDIKWGSCWGRGFASQTSLVEIWYGVPTLGGGTGESSGVASVVNTLVCGAGDSSCGGSVVDVGVD